MKLKLTRNTQIGLTVAGVLLYGALGWMLLVSPQGGKLSSVKEETAAVEAQIVQARIASRRTVEKVEPIRVADLFRLSKAMPDQTDMPGVLLELNRIARDSGIVFDSIVPGPSSELGGFRTVPVDLVFQGNYYDLADFLFRSRSLVGVRDGELEASGRLFNVLNIEFSEASTRFPEIRAALKLEAYVYGSAGAPAAAAAPPATPAPAAGAVPPEGLPVPDVAPTAVGATP